MCSFEIPADIFTRLSVFDSPKGSSNTFKTRKIISLYFKRRHLIIYKSFSVGNIEKSILFPALPSFFLPFLFQCDQPKEGMVNDSSKMDDYCEEKGFIGWFETSAKENINIDDAAKYLVQKVGLVTTTMNNITIHAMIAYILRTVVVVLRRYN